MSEERKERPEPFNGIVVMRTEIPRVRVSSEGYAIKIMLGIVEELEPMPEHPIVYLHSFYLDDSWKSSLLRDAKCALREGDKVRVKCAGWSEENVPWATEISFDTTQLAATFLRSSGWSK